MNIEQLNSYIGNKERLDQKAIAQIMLLIEKYPYFQTAHMLLLKAMHLNQPEKFNGQLKISASFLSDKKKLYQYIHDYSFPKTNVEEKKATLIAENIDETNKIEKVQEIKSINEVTEVKKVETNQNEILEATIPIEKKLPIEKVEEIVKKTETIEVAENVIKKPDIQKKIDLPKDKIENLANQNSEVKHKKIVSDFFHNPAKEIPEKKTTEKEEDKLVAEKNPEIKEKKEFPSKVEIKSILEEKKRNIISKNEPIIAEKKISSEAEIEKTEVNITAKNLNESIEKEIIIKRKPIIVEKIIETDEQVVDKEITSNENRLEVEEKKIPIVKKPEEEIVHKRPIIEKEILNDKTEEIKGEKTVNQDTMSNIFSKIRQIKKEMNLESVNSSETIDINVSKTPKIEKTTKEEVKNTGKVIKESFIGFQEFEIKKEDLISDEPIKIRKETENSDENDETYETEKIKESGIAAKELFKQHIKNKETEINSSLQEKVEENKSPIYRIVEKMNLPEIEKLEVPEHKNNSQISDSQISEKIFESSISGDQSESAADALLKRIAEKKRKMHEEKENEEKEKSELEKRKLQEKIIIIEEKIEIPEIKSETVEQIGVTKQQDEIEELSANQAIEESSLPKTKKSQFLIDNFIEKVDSLERLGTKEIKLTGDVSEKSTEENDEFMTETLADLLIQQKNYSKAIEIYNKLILKFPEKKTYFAIQIKKTESLIK